MLPTPRICFTLASIERIVYTDFELTVFPHTIVSIAYPRSDMVIELQDEDEMYVKQWSEGFEGGGVQWGGFLPDDD